MWRSRGDIFCIEFLKKILFSFLMISSWFPDGFLKRWRDLRRTIRKLACWENAHWNFVITTNLTLSWENALSRYNKGHFLEITRKLWKGDCLRKASALGLHNLLLVQIEKHGCVEGKFFKQKEEEDAKNGGKRNECTSDTWFLFLKYLLPAATALKGRQSCPVCY